MINKNLSKISEFGIWLIQWFGDFSKDIKVLQIRTLNSIIRFLVAPHQRKAKDSKILISKRNQDFLFSHKTQNPAIIIDERQKVQLQFPKYHPDVLPYVANGMKSL